jgi:hypothetical protein
MTDLLIDRYFRTETSARPVSKSSFKEDYRIILRPRVADRRLPLQIDGAILIIWGIVEFNAPAPGPGVTSVSGYATAMTPDIRHMLSHNWDPAMELTGKCEP